MKEDELADAIELEDIGRRLSAMRHRMAQRAAKRLTEHPPTGPCCTHQCAPRPEPVPMCSEAMDDLDEEDS